MKFEDGREIISKRLQQDLIEDIQNQFPKDKYEVRVTIPTENPVENFIVFVGSKDENIQKSEHVWFSSSVVKELLTEEEKESKAGFFKSLFRRMK